MLRPLLLLSVFALMVAACSSPQRIYEVTEVDRPPEFLEDSLVVEVERENVAYVQPERITPDRAPDRVYDLLTTALDLQFDFADQTVMGTARHTLTPLRDSLRSFYFHAEAMDIAAVRQVVDGRGVGVGYEVGEGQLTITPRTPLQVGETYEFVVDYIAQPGRVTGKGGIDSGGKGLYFIDPSGTDPYRPTQIWTQGSAEDNRRWFPTWDYPNDRQAYEITLTVPDSMRTVSNGALVEKTALEDGMRRDRWVLAGDQVAYLAAVVVGDFATVRDTVESTDGRAIPLEYIVEPGFADEVPAIFSETPAMLTFFEEYLGIPYPWDNYKQVAVRDFPFGGMENTSLTVLHEDVQTDEAARLDYDARDLIAHELAHQWFGDLVTTEDWANLALNKSFASYLEALYLEDEFGRDAAQAHGIGEREGYFEQADTLRRPIVWYGYEDAEDVYDAHTYQKGAQVLNQLRFELGDAAFRRGLNRYLTDNAYQTAELADLRQAFEAASGRGLHRFFDQWWTEPGHPVLSVEQAYFAGSGLYTVQVVQQQNQANAPVYHFDLLIELNYPTRPKEVRRVRITSADTTLRFDVPEKPTFVRVNEGDWAFVAVTVEQPLVETLAQATTDDELAGRYQAVETLSARDLNAEVRETLVQVASDDAHPLVRERAVEALAKYARVAEVQQTLRALGREDASPAVRQAALSALVPADTSAQARAVLRAALTDPSLMTQAVAVGLYAKHYPGEAFEAFQPLLHAESKPNAAVVTAIARYRLGDEAGARYLAERAGAMNSDAVRLAAVAGLRAWARVDEDTRSLATETFVALVGTGTPRLRRTVAEALGEIGGSEALTALEAQRDAERDEAVKVALEAAIEQAKKGSTQVGSDQVGSDR